MEWRKNPATVILNSHNEHNFERLKTMNFLKPTALACLSTLLGACAGMTPAGSSPATDVVISTPSIDRPSGETPAWWFNQGAAEAANLGASKGRAKNLILFVGDGMSLTTVAAARIFEGQSKGGSGEENRLSWERWPHTALSRTYNTDSQTPDSAGTMSAMATGVKTRLGVLSIGQTAPRGDCSSARKAELLTLWELAASSGMATGVVSTARVTHATPGATFSHSADRNWEDDTKLKPKDVEAGCVDIARQMVETRFGHGPDVLMGGGRARFMTAQQTDPEYPNKKGARRDGRDLIADWKARHPDGTYVWNEQQLRAAPTSGALLALFEPSHMQYEHDRARDGAGEPSLAEMTRAAITRLKAQPNGYVLLVEGGRIDHANHAGNAYRALSDTVALSDAVRAAQEMSDSADTLMIVTADHSHTLTFVGYPARGNPILGKVKGGSGESSDAAKYARDASGLPYTTLVYANGPGNVGATSQQAEGPKKFDHEVRNYKRPVNARPNLENVNTEDPDYMQEALVPMGSETHGGDDVGVWAWGAGANAVRGNVEENTIFHFLLQASPRLRSALCAKSTCVQGVPTTLPDPTKFVGADNR